MEKKSVNVAEAARLLRQKEISVPAGFAAQVQQDGGKSIIHVTDVEETLKLVNFWKPLFVSKEEYDRVVIRSIRRLFKIGCFVYNNNTQSDFFIGRYGKIKEGEHYLLKEMITTAFESGGHCRFINTSSRFTFKD